MSQLLHSIIPRRRGFSIIKVVIVTVVIFFIIDFGFRQDANEEKYKAWSLERKFHRKFRAISITDDVVNEVKENVANSKEQEIMKEFLNHVRLKAAETRPPYVRTKKVIPDIRPAQVQIESEHDEEKNEPAVNANVAEKKIIDPENPPDVIDKPDESESNCFNVEHPGELGEPVKMPKELSPEIKKLYDDGWQAHQFNQYLSDHISVHRSLPDFRNQYCQAANYSKVLPSTSVIFIFHNEAWSTLLRSVHSVLDRSPEHLIEEIILVDDFSDMDHLKKPLEDYMANYPKVKILRADQREGLIKARIRGAKFAKGQVLTFLDSHIECTTGWLEPLLDRVAQDPTNVVCPLINGINDETFALRKRSEGDFQVGGFVWSLIFRWIPIQSADKKRKNHPYEPTRSPTMAGGLFSIDKEFFTRLGMYDPEFDIWGAENLELSFKTWMCGGTLEIIPCSQVGHIFRKKSPYTWRPGVNVGQKNSIRLAEVWMDEYSRFYYMRMGNKSNIDYGDISSRVKLRKDLNCKSFKWYMENIYPEKVIPDNLTAFGEIRNLAQDERWCIDAPKEKPVAMFKCHENGGNQYFEYDKGKILRENLVFTHSDAGFEFKKPNSKDQIWFYEHNSMNLIQKTSKKCLTMTDKHKLILQDCLPHYLNQKWKLKNLNQSKLSEIKFDEL